MDHNELYHYGVIGMKWGRRKDKSSNRVSKGSGRIKKGIAKIKKVQTPKKKIKNLSDEELQKKINRLQMEKRYRDLKKDEVLEGSKIVGSILKSSAKVVGTQLVVGTAGLALNKAIGQDIINIGGKKKDKK